MKYCSLTVPAKRIDKEDYLSQVRPDLRLNLASTYIWLLTHPMFSFDFIALN